MISEADKLEVENAIGEAEKGTSGEIVAVIARASGSYYYVPYLWGALAALIVPWPLIFWTWLPEETIYLIQLATFAVLAFVLHYEPLRFALVPRSVMRQRAHRRATQQFFAQNIYTTPGHTGVLLFVSVAERYAEIVTDARHFVNVLSGIHSRYNRSVVEQVAIAGALNQSILAETEKAEAAAAYVARRLDALSSREARFTSSPITE